MATLFGKEFTRDELLQRVGDMSQIAGVKLAELADGPEKGVAAAEFTTGSGLNFTVLPDRGLDISAASFNGKSLCWRSSTGDVSPAFFDARGLEWLRSFFGGLVCTCGLTYAGAPCADGDDDLGLHGRVSNTPARNVAVDCHWDDDEYVLSIKGEVREGALFRDSLVLTRQIWAKAGASALAIHDVVENRSYNPAPHMMLYHMNFGFPVVSERSQLVAPSLVVTPRDDVAEDGKRSYAKFHEPTAGYAEKCYYHDLAAGRSGATCAGIVNRSIGFGAYVKFDKSALPFFCQWKQMGQGNYVVGLEPANCHVEGRDKERVRGTLTTLEPGERREYFLEVGVLDGRKAIKEFEDGVKKLKGNKTTAFSRNDYER